MQNHSQTGQRALAPERATLLLERALTIYERNLADLPEGGAYLNARGITDEGLWRRHRLGYSDGQLTELLPREGKVWDELKGLGILKADGQERFAGCVVFPVIDAEGHLGTLCGRHTATAAQNIVSLSGRPTGLWNAVALKSYPHILLVQSMLDGLSVEMAGYTNVIAIEGPAGLKKEDVATLGSYGVQRITLLFEGGEAGHAPDAAWLTLLATFQCEAREMPQDLGPNRYLIAYGPKALAQVLADRRQVQSRPAQSQTGGSQAANPVKPPAAQPISGGFCVQLGLRHYEVRGLEKGPRKLKATVRVEYAGKLHVDTLDFYSARARRQLTQDLTRIFEEPADLLQADVTRLMTLCEQLPEPEVAASSLPSNETMTPEERAQAEAFGRHPDILNLILTDFERCGLVGERANKLLCYLACVSRKMDKPLSVLILSSSGAGKTTLQDVTLAFCPPEDLVKLTSLSGKALFYKEGASLKHKALALEEGDGVEEAMYALRNLISAGELVTEATIKDSATGRLTTMENRVEGPTAVFLTTTNPEIDPETKSRFFVTSVDEGRAQTQAILAYQRQRHTLTGLADGVKRGLILQKHWHFQRLLRPVSVVNPFADQLDYGDDRLQSRRDQPKYLTLIRAVAFLRQMQKPVKTLTTSGQYLPYIEVDRQDIRLANELAQEMLGHSLDELSRPALELLKLLAGMSRGEQSSQPEQGSVSAGFAGSHQDGFTRRQIREFTGWSNIRVHRLLKELVELEFVLAQRGRNGVRHHYRLAYGGQGQNGSRFILGLKSAEELQDKP